MSQKWVKHNVLNISKCCPFAFRKEGEPCCPDASRGESGRLIDELFNGSPEEEK